MRLPCLLLVAALALAGCSGGTPEERPHAGSTSGTAAPPPADFSDLDLKATKTTGVLRGVVVDATIMPIAGAAVTLQPGNLSMAADREGRFGFEDLEPGAYLVRAAKEDYAGAQASVQVVAGESEPRATMLVLERVLGTEPYVDAMSWDGYLQCSLIAAGFFFTGCMASDVTGDDSRREDPIAVPPQFMQSELTWQSTQALGSNLCMKHYARDGTDFEPIRDTQDRLHEACGAVPVVQSFNRTELNATHVGEGRGVERVVWVAYAVDGALGLAFQQQFTVFTHVFHNFVPDEGWVFVRDGSPRVPPA
jgi:hypothetical protein